MVGSSESLVGMGWIDRLQMIGYYVQPGDALFITLAFRNNLRRGGRAYY